MLFRNLSASPALDIQRYADIDHFRQSERYAHAESIPLKGSDFSVMRASLALPSCRLSLVRTFPRIINGYELSRRLIVVIPMDGVSSTKVNGRAIGQSLILLHGNANCTVLEPEGRLASILSIDATALDQDWLNFTNAFLLLRLPAAELAQLQALICSVLEFASKAPAAITAAGVLQSAQETLFAGIKAALHSNQINEFTNHETLDRYKAIVDRVDELVQLNPIDHLSNEKLADAIGISVRTLQTASFSVCGSGTYRYSRLRRLWSVRRHLRTGAPGLTVKASAIAHGFWHQSAFSNAYRAAFGELPSLTLEHARVRDQTR
jgi:AraC family transcriptional regulator, ethanolamine operon transcriptional activator